MEMNNTIIDLKMEVDIIKKTQSEATMEIETLGKKSGTIVSISNRIQEMEDRIAGAEDSKENMDTTIKENAKMQKDPNSKHSGNPGHNEKTKPTHNRNI
jgi:malonyl CoA-acyl carrier protein transacylase